MTEAYDPWKAASAAWADAVAGARTNAAAAEAELLRTLLSRIEKAEEFALAAIADRATLEAELAAERARADRLADLQYTLGRDEERAAVIAWLEDSRVGGNFLAEVVRTGSHRKASAS